MTTKRTKIGELTDPIELDGLQVSLFRTEDTHLLTVVINTEDVTPGDNHPGTGVPKLGLWVNDSEELLTAQGEWVPEHKVDREARKKRIWVVYGDKDFDGGNSVKCDDEETAFALIAEWLGIDSFNGDLEAPEVVQAYQDGNWKVLNWNVFEV